MKQLVAAMGIVFMSTSIYAAEAIDWKVCEKEIKEFQCTGDDKSIWSCLEKHDDALSKECQVSHAKGDELFKE